MLKGLYIVKLGDRKGKENRSWWKYWMHHLRNASPHNTATVHECSAYSSLWMLTFTSSDWSPKSREMKSGQKPFLSSPISTLGVQSPQQQASPSAVLRCQNSLGKSTGLCQFIRTGSGVSREQQVLHGKSKWCTHPSPLCSCSGQAGSSLVMCAEGWSFTMASRRFPLYATLCSQWLAVHPLSPQVFSTQGGACPTLKFHFKHLNDVVLGMNSFEGDILEQSDDYLLDIATNLESTTSFPQN